MFSKYRNMRPLTQNVLGDQNNGNIINTITAEVATSSQQLINYNGDWQKTLSKTTSPSSWSDPASATVTSANAPLTATDIFSRDLLAQYASAKQAGEDTSDPQVQADIAGQVMSDGTVLATAKVYDKSSVKISADNSIAALKQYGDTISTIFKTNIDTSQPNELSVVQDSVSQNDPTILKKLDPIIANDTKILNGLLTTRVPSGMIAIHLSLINAVNELIFADQSFTKTFSDGISSLQGLGLYQKATQGVADALTSIENYFFVMKVSFDPSESGSVFTVQPSTTESTQ